MIQGINTSHLSRTMIGSRAQERRLNIIANNLANVGTAGFKKDVPVFEDFIIKETRTHFAQGDMEFTGNRLDVGLNGPGFFQIETPNGTRYTRNGSFTLTSTG
ncbi:MAG: flagellar hook-basal body complex protein, partial [Thermodesulfobacteriota bacterium]|nr:flagellar hook-basal body complex protein [Thermodesulfobacteriota bacterium]